MVWTPAHNRDAWGWYLGHEVRAREDRSYAVPARRTDLTGLAPAWVGVGSADLFHDEDVRYAERLRDAGVPLELVVVPGMPHAADMVPGLVAAQGFRESFVAAVARALTEPTVERQSE
ncbi:alpha/beta hydrolase fold domain-containing protein [Ornithinimicrobium sp. CNJ-824]|uniref:alpha/beta hydrolase fold domain-containing protein n=1 Tax=Ornithinimicrobium sp. CNJ-824 TaxID=1904966 RepID=UPI0022A9EC7C|nr:alpha/beta hydrolase fold domain-containing protein [Ornithinimicrobium sp. CNJ-824]